MIHSKKLAQLARKLQIRVKTTTAGGRGPRPGVHGRWEAVRGATGVPRLDGVRGAPEDVAGGVRGSSEKLTRMDATCNATTTSQVGHESEWRWEMGTVRVMHCKVQEQAPVIIAK
uniref:Uncharacterized protein n=1 Tax=Oryza brachyantha TaxID=4533 RepID=J3MZS1_ORYBR